METKDIINGINLIFEFTEDEEDAIHGFIPMTQELFNACMEKCERLGAGVDKTYQKLITKYPELWENYRC